MSYPDVDTYQALYAKYLQRPVSALLDLAGDLKGKTVWDLCAGNGEISLACIKAGASKVIAVDSSADMLQRLDVVDKWMAPNTLEVKHISVERHLMRYQNRGASPDVVFCRQGVNYWLDSVSANMLSNVMEAGSQFIFNTFNTAPSRSPTVKHYEYNGHNFVEVSWLVGNMVYHTQVRDGMEPHATQFKWIPKEEIILDFENSFGIYIVEDGHTSLYRCTRK